MNQVRIVVFCVLLAVAACHAVDTSSYKWKGGLRVRYSLNLFNAFRSRPRTVGAAVEEGWTLRVRNESLPYQSLAMYCPSEPLLCTLYDDTGNVAGIQIALAQDRLEPVYDLVDNGYSLWSSEGVTYWVTTEYFSSEEYYSQPSAQRLQSRDPGFTLQTDEIYVTGAHGNLLRVPRNQTEMAQTGFVRHACIPGMGVHYYYNMTKDTICDGENLIPWFAIYDAGELIGVGFNIFASFKESGTKLIEYSPLITVMVTIHPSEAPKCMYELTRSPGAQTIHTYFIDSPGKITCLDNLNNLG